MASGNSSQAPLGSNEFDNAPGVEDNPHLPVVGDIQEGVIPQDLLDYLTQPEYLSSPNPTIEMLLGIIRNLRHENDLLTEKVSVLLRKLVTVDIQTEHVYLGVKRLVDNMIKVECDIRALRRNQETVAAIPNDQSFIDGARMVVSRFLGRGLISTEEVRQDGFSLFMEP